MIAPEKIWEKLNSAADLALVSAAGAGGFWADGAYNLLSQEAFTPTVCGTLSALLAFAAKRGYDAVRDGRKRRRDATKTTQLLEQVLLNAGTLLSDEYREDVKLDAGLCGGDPEKLRAILVQVREEIRKSKGCNLPVRRTVGNMWRWWDR